MKMGFRSSVNVGEGQTGRHPYGRASVLVSMLDARHWKLERLIEQRDL
jgi:hypothetical protein